MLFCKRSQTDFPKKKKLKTTRSVAMTTHPCQRYNAVVTATPKKCIKPSCGNGKLFKMIHVLSDKDFVMLQY